MPTALDLDAIATSVLPRRARFCSGSMTDYLVADIRSSFDAIARDVAARDAARLGRPSPLLSGRLRECLRQSRAFSQAAVDNHVCASIAKWRNSVAELLVRLETDWDVLAEDFHMPQKARLLGISDPLGDFHNGGRAVCKLTFTDGRIIVYKPRPVVAEHTFAAFVDWLKQSGCEPALVVPKTLPRGDYGWMEFVPSVFAESHAQAQAFYERQGAFLFLFWLLGGGDSIADNVIVAGEHPVWVDLECICRPDIACMQHTVEELPLWIRRSVLTTAMLFYGKSPDVAPRHGTGLTVSCAKHRLSVFTDHDVLKPPYLKAVADGFSAVYRHILQHTKAVNAGPLEWWRDCPARVLLRPTSLYMVLAHLMVLAPENLHQTIGEAVAEMLRDATGGHRWPEAIVESELLDLADGDVPYWALSSSTRDLRNVRGEIISDVASSSGMEGIRRRAAAMSAEDLEKQAWLIQSMLGGHTTSPPSRTAVRA